MTSTDFICVEDDGTLVPCVTWLTTAVIPDKTGCEQTSTTCGSDDTRLLLMVYYPLQPYRFSGVAESPLGRMESSALSRFLPAHAREIIPCPGPLGVHTKSPDEASHGYKLAEFTAESIFHGWTGLHSLRLLECYADCDARPDEEPAVRDKCIHASPEEESTFRSIF